MYYIESLFEKLTNSESILVTMSVSLCTRTVLCCLTIQVLNIKSLLPNVTHCNASVKVEDSVTSKETKKLSEFHQISKLWDSQPLVVKVTVKSDISIDYGPSATAQLVAASSN